MGLENSRGPMTTKKKTQEIDTRPKIEGLTAIISCHIKALVLGVALGGVSLDSHDLGFLKRGGGDIYVATLKNGDRNSQKNRTL